MMVMPIKETTSIVACSIEPRFPSAEEEGFRWPRFPRAMQIVIGPYLARLRTKATIALISSGFMDLP
jgi:hypothetical protein